MFPGHSPDSQDQVLVVTVLYVPGLLEILVVTVLYVPGLLDSG